MHAVKLMTLESSVSRGLKIHLMSGEAIGLPLAARSHDIKPLRHRPPDLRLARFAMGPAQSNFVRGKVHTSCNNSASKEVKDAIVRNPSLRGCHYRCS